jgi:hypothetical protein
MLKTRFELPASSRGTSAAAAQVSAAATFLGGIAVLASTKTSMQASGITPAADRGATEGDFCHEGTNTLAT